MRTISLVTFFIVFSWCGNLLAQTPLIEAPKEQGNCRISLPYRADQFPTCSPQSAAAYDFAFCSVSYIITSLLAPDSDKAMGENSKTQAFHRKGMAYANISAALSDSDVFQRNVTLTKKYYESLKETSQLINPSIQYVRTKCSNIESWHSEVLSELAQRLKLPPNESR